MEYMRRANEIYYIDFTMKDFKNLVFEYSINPRTISIRIMPNNLDEFNGLSGIRPLL